MGDGERSARAAHDATPRISDPWFRTVAENTATAIFVYTLDRILYVNPAAAELAGRSVDELLELGPDDLLFEEDREASRERRRQRLAGAQLPERREIRFRHASGEERWIDFSAGTVPIDGRLACLSTAVDITPRKSAERALVEYRERLELAQRAGHSVVWEWDLATDHMQLSHFAADFYEMPREKLPRTGAAMQRFIHPDDRQSVNDAIARALREDVPYVIEHRIVTPAGTVRWLGVRGVAVRDGAGRAIRVVGVSADVTRLKLVEAALDQEKEEAQITLASIGDGVIRVDSEGLIGYLNPAAERLTGFSRADAVGRPLESVYRVVDEVTRVPRAPRPEATDDPNALPAPRVLVRGDGAELAVRDSAAWIRDRSGHRQGMVVIFKDVSLQRGIEREMSFLASHDPLTGLRNRREFERQVRQIVTEARERERPAVMLFVDLDDFKSVNDSCGHLAGDELLRQLATLLSSLLRERDIIARVGGDEFGVLLPDCPTSAGQRVAEKLRAAVRAFRFEWSSRIFEVGASIGLVPITAASGGLRDLLAAADAALYLAKERGRNRVHIATADERGHSNLQGDRELQILAALQRALRDGTLEVWGQPLAKTSRCADDQPELIEVLVRLPFAGAAAPLAAAEFLPVAERHQLLTEVDLLVLDLVCARVLDHGLPDGLRMCLNLSAQTLADSTSRDAIAARLDKHPSLGAKLCFELQETAVLSHLPAARALVESVRRRGARFVLDDVGSGLGAFAYLRSLEVDYLKIDGSFVAQMADEPVLREVVLATTRIGRTIGAATVGERVEDRDILDAMSAIDIDYLQGFAIGMPAPLDQVLDRR